MRVTSNLMFNSGMTALQNKQQELMNVQEKSLTGNRMNRPSDDPTSVYRHLLFSSDLSGVKSLKKNTEFASQRVALADDQISQVHERMLEAQDLVMKMSSSSVGGQPQIMIAAAEEAEAMYQEVMSNINTELDEVPIFGGGRTRIPYQNDLLEPTKVRVQANGEGGLSFSDPGVRAKLADDHSLKDIPLSVKVNYLASKGKYEVNINGVNHQSLLEASATVPPVIDLGNGLSFELGTYVATPIEVQTAGQGALAPADAGYQAKFASNHTLTDASTPMPVSISYAAATQEFTATVAGKVQEPVKASADTPPIIALGKGLTLEIGATPTDGDVFSFNVDVDSKTPDVGDSYYFEVVAKYQGGPQDRPVRIMNGATLPGNSTAKEVLEGTGSTGRNVNILGALAALRGALLRADPTEVAVQLNRIQEGRAQVSDLQAISGIRVTQVDAVNNTLALDEASIMEMKATNVEADLVEVLSNLEQTSQAMQVMTITERQVLNTSLIDFIR